METQTQQDPAFNPPFLYWSRFFARYNFPDTPATGVYQLCSWSYTGVNATGLMSPVTCELIQPPRGSDIITPVFNPSPLPPIVTDPPTWPGDPVTVTPEPGTAALLGLGLVAAMLWHHVRRTR